MGENWRADRAYKHSRQRCIRCGQIDAFTLAGKKTCAACCEKQANYYQEHREAQVAARKALREARKAAGLCPECGQPNNTGFAACEACRRRDRYKARRRREKQKGKAGANWPRGDNGVCYLCNKRPLMPGKGLCEVCYGKAMDNLGKANQQVNNWDHPWRRQMERDQRRKNQTVRGGLHAPVDGPTDV